MKGEETLTEIETNNRLIGEFMGADFKESKGCFTGISYFLDYTKCELKPDDREDQVWIHHIFYHTSWDWLMPVVEKIESMSTERQWFTVLIQGKICSISRNWIGLHGSSSSTIGFESTGIKIENTHKAIIEFIHWHNANHK